MRKLTSLAVATLLVLAVPAPPASAAGGAAFTGTWRINNFGSGTTWGTGDLCVTGTINGLTAVCMPGTFNVDMSFQASVAPSTCPLAGTGSGSFTGAVTGSIDWTMLGGVLIMSVPPGGSFTAGGTGSGVFAITSPLQPFLICGVTVTAAVAGVVHAN